MISLQSFLRSTAGNYSIMILKMAAGIFMIPVCLQLYGEELFGIYLLSFGLSTTLTFLDFGVNKTLLRYTAEFRANKDTGKFAMISSSSFSLNLVASVLIAFIILLAGFLSNNVFHIQAEHRGISISLFALSAFNGSLVILGYFPSGILTGLALFEKRNKWQAIPPILYLLFIFYMYETRNISILWFATANVAITLLTVMIDYILLITNSISRYLSYRIRLTRQMFRSQHMNYTAGVFVLSAVGFLGIQADRLIIAGVSTISAVTIYTIVTRPYFVLKSLFANSYTVLMPPLVKENSRNNIAEVHQMITKVTRASIIILFSIILFISLFFEYGLHIWLNTTEYDKYTIWGIVALLNICIPAFYGLLSRLMILSEHVWFILKTNTWLILINFISSIILTYFIGFPGVILGTTIQMIFEFALILGWGVRKLHYKPSAIFTTDLVSTLFFLVLISTLVKFMIINNNILMLLPAIIVMVVIYAIAIILFVRADKTMSAFKPS